jgi:hypothetical protein
MEYVEGSRSTRSARHGICRSSTAQALADAVLTLPHRGVSDPERLVYIHGRETYPVYRYLRDTSSTLALAASQAMQVDIRFGDVAVRSVVPARSSDAGSP